MIAALTPVLLFVAFLLLLLVSLSAPIISNIHLFRLSAHFTSSLLNSGATGSVKFGVWGYCISAIKVAVAGIHHDSAAKCSEKRLGYTFDNQVADALNADEITNLISRTTTAALVLHPIACALTFLTLLTSLFILRRGSNGTSRLPSLLTLIIGTLAAFLTTVVFLIDVIVIAIVRKRVHNASDGDLDLNWGNAVWMTLGATVALWLAMIGACCGIFACGGRRHTKTATY